jgi:hypothetical protein
MAGPTNWRRKRMDKNMLPSAVCFQMPSMSPTRRNLSTRWKELRGKLKFPDGKNFVEGIYEPSEKHVASGIPVYAKRSGAPVYVVLNELRGRWQIQATDRLNSEDCYAYCEKAFAQPERCTGHPWQVLERDGTYTEYQDVLITTQPSAAQLALIDRDDRVSRLIGSTTKMTSIKEALEAMSFVAYSEDNLKNVALVMKVRVPWLVRVDAVYLTCALYVFPRVPPTGGIA